ncbi:hypothetical protein FACS1894142_6470 [Spirochaetia bacterium]|nr:hypothetical protein FACS1894142_6470 [Spirochaetia bacterium]
MEDVLDLYQRPYNKEYPVVCLDETTRQLIGETRIPIPATSGRPKRYDYEYVRNGVAHFFMMFEPLKAKRFVRTSESHTRIEFAYCLKDLADTQYPDAVKILLVMDNLNIHSLASLYLVFPPEQARSLAERFEIHYTPKHGSWLNMAEIEIGVMSRQCLNQRIPTLKIMKTKIKAWETIRNKQKHNIRWQFTTKDARIKLQHLYPKL